MNRKSAFVISAGLFLSPIFAMAFAFAADLPIPPKPAAVDQSVLMPGIMSAQVTMTRDKPKKKHRHTVRGRLE